jgi:D-amino-acid dehydrogenase
MRIVIVGAGIVGLTTAHALLDQGHEVILVDKGKPSAATSRGNAGWIAHTDILPLASPKVVRQMARWLLDPLGPLTIRPAYLPRLAPWLFRFLLASRPAEVERSIQAIIPLQALALPAWERLLGKLGLEPELNRHGVLYAFDAVEPFEAAMPVHQRQQELGIPLELLDGPAIRALEPALSDRIVRGVYYPTVAHVSDPYELGLKLAAAVRQRGGRLEQAAVVGVPLAQGDEKPVVVLDGGKTLAADVAVIAAGAWSKPLAATLGDPVPLDSERGYNATITEPGVSLTRPVLLERHGFVLSPLKPGLRIGGAVELASTEAKPNWKRAQALFAKACLFVPGLRDGGRSYWMGCRPSLPDSLPVISRSRASPRVIYAFGHGHHGLTQAAATADLVAALVGGRAPAIDLKPYSVERFWGRNSPRW